mmetsp:Transcript_9045/g.20062  ORF Transcript_9045/g.20062 Transcript_9045/m.20062 type:complete len:125 (+) Transcript_9045:91-465(+)
MWYKQQSRAEQSLSRKEQLWGVAICFFHRCGDVITVALFTGISLHFPFHFLLAEAMGHHPRCKSSQVHRLPLLPPRSASSSSSATTTTTEASSSGTNYLLRPSLLFLLLLVSFPARRPPPVFSP